MKLKKSIICIFSVLAFSYGLSSCDVDNIDAPYCHITGKMCYQGSAIGVRGSGIGDESVGAAVRLELWQSGFGKETAQTINVAQDGTFSTYVYPGDVRIISKKGVGPWEDADTLRATVKGDINLDYEVTPYFTISDVNYVFNSSDSTLTANFQVNQVVAAAKVKALGLLVNDRKFVDLSYSKASSAGTGHTGNVQFKLDLKSLGKCKSLYARVYVKADIANDAVYSTESFLVW